MNPHKISLETARIFAVVKQGLHRRPSVVNKDTLLQTIRQIKLLQIDSINVVARSHYLVMLSRVGLYNPADLDAISYQERHLFEQLAHVACLIPMEDYPFFAPRIHARRGLQHYWAHKLGEHPQQTLDDVLAQIRERGPLASKDFADPRGKRGTWWDWKPAKAALDILFHWGDLMISHRINFQRYYDLTERVLPEIAQIETKTLDDWHQWTTMTGIRCLGAATVNHARDYYRKTKAETRRAVESLAANGVIVPVEVEGWQEMAYVDSGDVELLEQIADGVYRPDVTTFLSPFDNLIWDRQRVQQLFQFDYRLEAYAPASQKRKYGYYVTPILHQGRLVGRLDPKADRKQKLLILRAIYLEPGEVVSDELLMSLTNALREFMRFHGLEELKIEYAEPSILIEKLRL